MGKISIANSRYSYINEGEWPSGSVDIHNIIVRKSFVKSFFVPILVFVLLLPIASYFFSFKENSATLLLWSFLLSGLLVILLLLWKPVDKESVIIMPAFGVQLETHYSSGRIIRRFIPAGEILKPVLLECVTPVTCYWSLSLLVRGKEELMLVFKELRPPTKMLLPVWKALCASIDNKESPVTYREDG
ncbi:uncharacterized protein LOC111292741 isoform X2 [Durio zibethinus]|uniref:Uncharacterized protein LOC111292741 isoform X2 n=1 Tax=Durio zibethinus TaxID=66656 RepID=A0A6P5YLQ2_DURZI|nr:uncharacterized protein LOC111292741 isoform X2 [Durio zibethinus]